jgi:hypothetical protein
VARSAFEVVGGAQLLRCYESSPGKFRYFCGACGSPVYSCRDQLPQVVRIRAGLIDGPLPVRLGSQAYVASKANWWTIDDRLPAFAQARDPAGAS